MYAKVFAKTLAERQIQDYLKKATLNTTMNKARQCATEMLWQTLISNDNH